MGPIECGYCGAPCEWDDLVLDWKCPFCTVILPDEEEE